MEKLATLVTVTGIPRDFPVITTDNDKFVGSNDDQCNPPADDCNNPDDCDCDCAPPHCGMS